MRLLNKILVSNSNKRQNKALPTPKGTTELFTFWKWGSESLVLSSGSTTWGGDGLPCTVVYFSTHFCSTALLVELAVVGLEQSACGAGVDL